jgi:hypothetical protein
MNTLTTNHHCHRFSPQYFKPYYSNNRLLFQFILSEFILTLQEMQIINRILTELKPAWSKLTEEQLSETFQALAEHMSKLSGSSQHYMRLLSWNDDGFLTKLKNYCALLCQQDTGEDRNQTKMYLEVNQAWLLSMQFLDIIRAMSMQPQPEESINENGLHIAQEKLNRSIQRLSRLVMRMVLQYRDDENVVYFLIRHKKQLDELYKPGYVASIIRKMFPKGTQNITQFLVTRYTERGFDSLIPVIQKKIAELKIK